MKGNDNVVPVCVMKAQWGRRGIAPLILNLGTRWSRVVEINIMATLDTLLLEKTLPAPT
jgi:hypothetical protein